MYLHITRSKQYLVLIDTYIKINLKLLSQTKINVLLGTNYFGRQSQLSDIKL
jgi:hypothetical protein